MPPPPLIIPLMKLENISGPEEKKLSWGHRGLTPKLVLPPFGRYSSPDENISASPKIEYAPDEKILDTPLYRKLTPKTNLY